MTEQDHLDELVSPDAPEIAPAAPGTLPYRAALAVGVRKSTKELEAAYGSKRVIRKILFTDEDGTETWI